MADTVHIEGMGVIGSFVAHHLAAREIPFTWTDTDQRVNAWRASTSIVYPSGEHEDQVGWWGWEVWRRYPFASYCETVPWCFTTKSPPHKGKFPHSEAFLGDWKMAVPHATCVNVQQLVQDTRRQFQMQRVDARPEGAYPLVAHGFNPRRVRYMWGWSRPVLIEEPAPTQHAAYYHRQGRFVMAYAYPIANTSQWWAGSSLISQKGDPRRLDAASKYAKWKTIMAEQGITVLHEWPLRQGWRPVGDDVNDTAWWREVDGKLTVRPLWHSGVRWAPQVIGALQELI